MAGSVASEAVAGTTGQKLMMPHNSAAAITTNKTATAMIPLAGTALSPGPSTTSAMTSLLTCSSLRLSPAGVAIIGDLGPDEGPESTRLSHSGLALPLRLPGLRRSTAHHQLGPTRETAWEQI